MQQPTRFRPLLLAVALLLTAAYCQARSAAAAEIPGAVSAVEDIIVTIKATGDLLPVVGDPFDVFIEIPGVGKAGVGQGKIIAIEGDEISATMTRATGRIQVGQQVIIHSAKPTKRPPGKVPLLIGRTAADAKTALTAAGLTAEFRIGQQPPAGVKPLTVYAQDPKDGAELARGGKVVVTLFANNGAKQPVEPATSNPLATAPLAAQAPDSDIPPPPAPGDDAPPPAPGTSPAANSAWLGATDWHYDNRVFLTGILKESPAAQGDLRVGDEILSIGQKPIGKHWNSFLSTVATFPTDQPVEIKLKRNGLTYTRSIKLQPQPADGGNAQLLAAAEAGADWAMVEIGLRFGGWRREWSFVPAAEQSPRLAAEWFQKASHRHSALGCYFLALAYRNGQGVTQDPAQAVTWFKKAKTLSSAGLTANPSIHAAATERLAEQ